MVLFCITLCGCSGFGLNQKFPKHDLRITGNFIRAEQDNYYLFTGNGRVISDGYITEKDSLLINDSLYKFVFFARIIPERLDKEYDGIPSHPSTLYKLYIKGNFVKKPVSGYGNREFAVAEDVVGVE